jgi:hypothetical protein
VTTTFAKITCATDQWLRPHLRETVDKTIRLEPLKDFAISASKVRSFPLRTGVQIAPHQHMSVVVGIREDRTYVRDRPVDGGVAELVHEAVQRYARDEPD